MTQNQIFLRLQHHFPPSSLRRASCSLCPCTFQLLSDQINIVRAQTVKLLSTHDAGKSKTLTENARHPEHIALVCGVFFYLHRLYLAFHRPSIPHPPLTRGDASAGEAHSHRITLLSMAQRMDAENKRRDMSERDRRKQQSSRSRSASPGFGSPASAQEDIKSPLRCRVLSAVSSPPQSRPSSPFAHFEDEELGLHAQDFDTQDFLDLLLQYAQDAMAQQSKTVVRDLLLGCCEDGDRFLKPKLGSQRDRSDKVDWTDPTLSDFLEVIGRLVMVVFTLKEEVKIGPNTTKLSASSQTPGAIHASSRTSSRPSSPASGRSASGQRPPGIPRPAWGVSYSAKVRQHQGREKKRIEQLNDAKKKVDTEKFQKPKDRAKPKDPERRWMP